MRARQSTVLVVEDDETVAEIYRLALERAGYEVVVARDGIECLEKAAASRPDLIFLDIRMPRMDGIEALRLLAERSDLETMPVVMLSNFDDPALVKAARDLGAKEYLVKAGLNPAELPNVVSRWLGRPVDR